MTSYERPPPEKKPYKRPLTDGFVKKKLEPGKYYDGRASGSQLYLCVSKSGRKRWELRFTFAGHRRTHRLGPYPDLPLTDARDRAREICRTARRGEDPRAASRAAAGPTFRDAVESTLEVRASGGPTPQLWRKCGAPPSTGMSIR